MKITNLVALLLMVSFGAFANEKMTLTGDEATKLSSVLGRIGSVSDSGGGHIGTQVSDVSCNVEKYNKTENSCSLNIQNAQGDQVQTTLDNEKSNILINALQDVGIGGCGTENCGGFEAESISCYSRIPGEIEDGQTDGATCEIVQSY